MSYVIAVNAGSSSLKWKLFEVPEEKEVASGIAERIGLDMGKIKLKKADGETIEKELPIPNHNEALTEILNSLIEEKIIPSLDAITAVGHRVVAGGESYKDSVIVDDDVLAEIERLSELAPLHNPAEAKVIRVFREVLPNVQNVAVFDTSFHQTMPVENYLYSLPMRYYEEYKARRYGAHGTSHKYVSQRAAELLGKPIEELKIITCHLGNGASITAVDHGKSIDTSMGFTPLAGLTMGTRSGDIDASLIPFIMKKEGITEVQEFIDILNNESGLLGLSGLSSDMRDLRDAARNGNEQAEVAIKIFKNRIIKYIGSYMAEMNGCDAIVFTGGIGENDRAVRKDVCASLTFFGVDLDEEKNDVRGKEGIISKENSKISVLLVPTEEELMIVRDVERLTK